MRMFVDFLEFRARTLLHGPRRFRSEIWKCDSNLSSPAHCSPDWFSAGALGRREAASPMMTRTRRRLSAMGAPAYAHTHGLADNGPAQAAGVAFDQQRENDLRAAGMIYNGQ